MILSAIENDIVRKVSVKLEGNTLRCQASLGADAKVHLLVCKHDVELTDEQVVTLG